MLLSAAPTPWIAGVVMPPLGAMGIAFAITGNSTLQLTSNDTMRGRVMAIYTMVFLGSTPIGALLAGGLVVLWDPRIAFAISGVAAAVAGLTALSVVRRIGMQDAIDEAHEREAEARAAAELTQPELATGD
jgi:MFS family permease